ncbi:hypothetical protein ACEN9X_10025 [Mucilaginibacter sp. Mucisp86]|uniref:hypothetical protein n=1 Tax=Mucilaginibacter sp. Mucisp86 TaxID=3243060 RepID=UPI0039B37AF8
MKLFYTLVLVIFLLPSFVSAQSNYKQGYVITNNGETVNGFINYREWNSNPTNVSFKKTLTDKVETYKPQDISYFEVSGFESYQTATVAISKVKTDIRNMSDNIDTSSYTATVFLKLLQKGDNVSLLQYNDDIKTRYFIQDNKAGQPQELKYQPYFDKDSQSIKKKNIYYAQLIDLAHKYKGSNADDLINKIVVLNYNEGELLKVTNLLNNEDANKPEKSGDKKPAYRMFVGAGVNATKINGAGPLLPATTGGAKSYVLPEFTFGIDAPFNPNTGKLIFRTELTLLFAKASIDNIGTTYSSTTVDNESFNQITLSLRPQFICNFYNSDKFKYYAGAGLAINFSRYTGITYTKTQTSSTVAGYNNTAAADFPSNNTVWFAPMARTGFVINNKFEISFAYHVPTKIDFTANLTSVKVSTFEGGINYIF